MRDEAPGAGPAHQAKPRQNYRFTFAVLALGLATYGVLQSLVTPVLALLQRELHASQSAVTWVLTAYLLSASIFTPIMGRIGDRVGKQRVLVWALVALSTGSLIAALATNVGVMIAGRVVQGIGGGVIPLSFAIVRDEFPKERVHAAIGSMSSLAASGVAVGLVLAGPIKDAFNYHWLFWFPMILTAAAAVGAALFVPESPVRNPARISWTPAVLLSGWLVSLLLAVSEGPDWGWASGRVLGLLGLAVVVLAGWIAAERRAATPLIDLDMMRLPTVWTCNLVALLTGVTMFAMFAFIPQFVQTATSAGYGFGASTLVSGLILLPQAFGSLLVGSFAGRVVDRIGGRTMIVGGCWVATAAMALFLLAHDRLWEVAVVTGGLGTGFGMVFSAMAGLVVAAVAPGQTGVAAGMNTNIRIIGGSIGAAMMATIVTSNTEASGVPAERGYLIGGAVCAGVLVLAAVAALRIPDPRHASRRRGPSIGKPAQPVLAATGVVAN